MDLLSLLLSFLTLFLSFLSFFFFFLFKRILVLLGDISVMKIE